MELTEKDAAIAYAKAWNQLDCSEFLKLLDDDAHYASQWVFSELENNAVISEYLVGKMNTVKNTDSKVYAELGIAHHGKSRHCVLMAQGDKDKVAAIIIFKIKNNKISRYDMCVPQLHEYERTGIYPN